MTCDHASMKTTLPTFLQATTFLGFVIVPGARKDDPDEVLAHGRCNGCDTTLAVVVSIARGTAVRGEIEAFADSAARAVPGQDVISDDPPPVRDEMAEHARRVIS